MPAGLDWERWCGPAEVVPYNIDLYTPRANPGWISFRPYSGGEVTGWGAHGLDQVQWALGMDETGPVELWTEGPAFDPPTYTEPEGRSRGEKICKNPTVKMRYANGVTLELGDGPESEERTHSSIIEHVRSQNNDLHSVPSTSWRLLMLTRAPCYGWVMKGSRS